MPLVMQYARGEDDELKEHVLQVQLGPTRSLALACATHILLRQRLGTRKQGAHTIGKRWCYLSFRGRVCAQCVCWFLDLCNIHRHLRAHTLLT